MLTNSIKWAADTKAAMSKKDVTVSRLARELCLTRGYVSAIVNGRIYAPSAMTRISQYLRTVPTPETEEERMQAEILERLNAELNW